MKTLEDMFREEHGNYTMIDVDALMDSQSPVEKVFAENKQTVQPVPQNAYQKGLELAGIDLDKAAKFLEGLGSVDIGGVKLTLRDLLPIDKGTSAALKTAGSGMPLTTGSGLQTQVKPEFGQAATEAGMATTLAKPIESGVTKLAKSAMKNKSKVAAGAAAMSASQPTRIKYDAEGRRVQ